MLDRVLDGRGVVVPAALLAVVLGWATARSPQDTAIALAALVAATLLLAHVEVLLLVLVAVLPWEDALTWPTEQITVSKLVGLALMAAWALRSLTRPAPVRLDPILVPVAVLGLAIGVSLVVSPDPAAGMLDARSVLLFAAFLFLLTQLVRTREDVRRVVAVTVLATTAAAAWALYRVVVLGTSRASGPVHDPNDFGFVLACTLPLAAYLATAGTRHRRCWVGCLVLIAAAALATFSRGALAGLAGLVVWGLWSRRVPLRSVMLVGGLAAIVVALAAGLWGPQLQDRLTSRQAIAEENVQSRLALWDGALRMAADRPLTGVGTGRFAVEAESYVHDDPLGIALPVAHNTYLQAVAETGVLGLAAFLAFLAAIWRSLRVAGRRAAIAGDDDERRLVVALQASVVVGLVAAAFITEHFATPFWLVGGLAAVLAAPRG